MTTFAVAAAALLGGCRTGIPAPVSYPVFDSEFHPTNRGWGSNPVWQDEFNGPSVDATKWVVAQFCGGYNNEVQCYTDRPENIHVGNGYLTITAWRQLPEEDDDDRALRCDGTDISMAANEVGTVNCPASDPAKPDYTYSSARIHTNTPGSLGWTYGRIEIRATMPYGQGTWPAFWMLPLPPTGPWPRSGEIDILETVNLDVFIPGNFGPTDSVQSNVHFCSDDPSHQDLNASASAQTVCQTCGSLYKKASQPLSLQLGNFVGTTPDLTRTFHTYAMEWTDVKMRFFVDDQFLGEVVHGPDCQSNAPFQHPFYLIINLAIGGDFPGPPNPATWALFHRALLSLDWVRVYACVGDPTAKNCAY
jgi:beta-glucanase (GH16 family)